MGISLQDTWNSFMEFLHGAFSGASFFEMGCEMWKRVKYSNLSIGELYGRPQP